MCFEEKKNEEFLQKIAVEVIERPARLSDFKQSQMNLALLHSMIAGGVSFNFFATYHVQEFMKLVKPSFNIPS